MNKEYTMTNEEIKSIIERYPESRYAMQVLFPGLFPPVLHSGAVLTHIATGKRYLLVHDPRNNRQYFLVDTETGYKYRGIDFTREGDHYMLTTDADLSCFHINSIGNVRAARKSFNR